MKNEFIFVSAVCHNFQHSIKPIKKYTNVLPFCRESIRTIPLEVKKYSRKNLFSRQSGFWLHWTLFTWPTRLFWLFIFYWLVIMDLRFNHRCESVPKVLWIYLNEIKPASERLTGSNICSSESQRRNHCAENFFIWGVHLYLFQLGCGWALQSFLHYHVSVGSRQIQFCKLSWYFLISNHPRFWTSGIWFIRNDRSSSCNLSNPVFYSPKR